MPAKRGWTQISLSVGVGTMKVTRLEDHCQPFCLAVVHIASLHEFLTYTLNSIQPPQTIATPYLSSRAVTLSGICGPLCSSPTTIGVTTPNLAFSTSCPFVPGEKSNCLTSVTKNACSSITLLVEKNQSVSSFISILQLTQRSGTYANRHPMQLLLPPENVALNQSASAYGRCSGQ